MKKAYIKKGIARLLFCLLPLLLALAPLALSAGAEGAESAVLADAEGKFFFGTEVLTDPVRVETDKGVYYAPTAYVYFGGDTDDPILFRVLDADADNAGNAGAVFLMAEGTDAWGDVRYALQAPENDWMDFENIYQMSYVGAYSYIYESVFTESYRTSNRLGAKELPVELDHIRPVTKNDDQAAMQGAFGYDESSTYTWYAPNNYYPLEGTELFFGNVLERQRVFPLSVEELIRYVGDYNGAPGLADPDGRSYWLRTALSDAQGNKVGVVRPDGTVEDASCFEEGVGVRFGINVVMDDVAFLYRVGEYNGAPVYKIAYRLPVYESTATPFSAWVTDVQDGVLTLEYTNAIDNGTILVDGKYQISVTVRDEDGNVIYYGTPGTETGYGGVPENGINKARIGSVRVTLPSDFDRETDTVAVFLEKKGSEESVSRVSNFVSLDCIHTPRSAASCKTSAVCADCGESYGGVDPDVHQTLIPSYFYDVEAGEHWRICADCGAQTLRESCTHGSLCTDLCVCENPGRFSEIQHDFDERGICRRDPSHTAPFEGSDDYYQNITIDSEGAFLSFAKYVNAGGRVGSVTLTADLDFSGIDFIPVGAGGAKLYCNYFDFAGHTLSGIHYENADGVAAIFPSVQYLYVAGGVTVKDSYFAGRAAAVLIGHADNLSVVNATVIEDCTVAGSEGAASLALSAGAGEVRAVGAYNVTDGEDFVPLVLSGGAEISDSAWYTAEVTEKEKHAWSMEDINAGALAYHIRDMIDARGYRVTHNLSSALYPTFVKGGTVRVHCALTCTGETVYFNDATLKAQIEAHNYTHTEKTPPEFLFDLTSYPVTATVRAVCGECGHVGEVPVNVRSEAVSDHSVARVIRIDYYVDDTLFGVTYGKENGVQHYIATTLESMIGLTPMTVEYDGTGYDSSTLLNNHRLDDGASVPGNRQFEAWFVNRESGEKYWHEAQGSWDYDYELPVDRVGVYDLVVVGLRQYEYQTVTYEAALTILPAHVTVTPMDVSRPADGTCRFTPVFEIEGCEWAADWFTLSYADAPSALSGVYKVAVTLSVNPAHVGCVDAVLTETFVTASILPAFAAALENKYFPTELVYGEEIPTPTPAHFGVDSSSSVTFSWYAVETDWWSGEIVRRVRVDAPKNVGTYLLEVIASPAEGYAVASRAEFTVEILPRTPKMSIKLPEGVALIPAKDEYSNPSCTVTAGQNISLSLGNLAYGESAESAGIRVEMEIDWETVERLPAIPTEEEPYHVVFRIYCDGNYETGLYTAVDVTVLPAEGGEAPEAPTEKTVLSLTLKAQEFNLSDDRLPYVKELVVTSADSILLAGHRITDAEIVIDKDLGKAYIASVTVLDADGADVSHLYTVNAYVENWMHTKKGENVVHLFDSACDETCAHCDYVRVGGHTLGTPADCLHGAVCADCGEVYTAPNPHRHVMAEAVCYPNPSTPDTHDVIYVCCGGVKERVPHTMGIPATCSEGAVCAECGWHYGETDPNNHGDALTYAPIKGSDTHHAYTCTACKKQGTEEHAGGSATCQSGALCTHCGVAYGEKNPDNHTANPVYTAKGEAHSVLYPCCEATLEEAHTGGSATCTERALCTHCGISYGTPDAHAHTSKDLICRIGAKNASVHEYVYACCEGVLRTEFHTGGSATCSSLAVCETCGSAWGGLDPDNHASEATVGVQNRHNAKLHDLTHACCGALISVGEHTGGSATCTHGEVCEVCGTDYGTPVSHVYDNDCDAVCNTCEVQTRKRVLHKDANADGACDACAEEMPKPTQSVVMALPKRKEEGCPADK